MSRSNKIAYSLCAIVVLAAIVAYAGLIPIGHWQDEFYTFYRLRDGGLTFMLQRLLTWSPRPLSELLVFVYGEIVLTTNKALVGSALTVTWLLTALMMFALPARFTTSFRTLVMLASVAVGALFLLDHPTGEMFYWPVAAFAYMPAIAALAAVFWLAVLDGMVSSHARRAAAILLIIAACSIEIGAMFVFCMSGIAAVLFVAPAHRREWRNMIWLIGPLIISAAILVLIYTGRVSHDEHMWGDATISHHFWRALKLALIVFFQDVLAPNWSISSGTSIAFAVIGKAFTFIAFYGIARVVNSTKRESIRWLTVLSLTCAIVTYLTVAAALYQFGHPSNGGRHDTFRQCLIYLSLISAACALGIRKGPIPHSEVAKFLGCLAIAVAIPFASSVKSIADDYARYAQFRAVKIANWNRGYTSDRSMTYEQITPGKIVGGTSCVKDKTYTLTDPETWWWIEGVIKFFHKDAVTFKTVH